MGAVRRLGFVAPASGKDIARSTRGPVPDARAPVQLRYMAMTRGFTFRLIVLMVMLGSPVRGEDAAQKPYLLHLNGIGGKRWCDLALLRGLTAGGLDATMEIYDWTGDDVGINALTKTALHEAESAKVARMLAEKIQSHPSRRIILTGHSGGCGIAVWALERLPAGMQVQTLVMFAPALSPEYDLSKALRHVRGKAYVFSSPLDVIVLDSGTKMFGTIDGPKVAAAGLNGFVQPTGADAEQYGKLVAQPYRRQWLEQYGNAGQHISCMGAVFVRDYVAPLLLESVAEGANRPATRPAALP